MNAALIGEQILRFRREAGMTQEELGRVVGVSAQAVSRWECGGTPDVTLVPQIADALRVSVGALFGREEGEPQDMTAALERWMRAQPEGERMARLTQLLWEALTPTAGFKTSLGYLEHGEAEIEGRDEGRQLLRSSSADEEGIMLSVGARDVAFFGVFPEPKEGYARYFMENDEYRRLFSALAMPGSLEIMRFLYARKKSFITGAAIARHVGLTQEQAHSCCEALCEAHLLEKEDVTLEEEAVPAYIAQFGYGFVPFLYFSRWIGQRSDVYYVNWDFRDRPVLKPRGEVKREKE